MVDFNQSPFFGPLGAPITQEQALQAVAPPAPQFLTGPQGGPQINPQAGQPTLPPGPMPAGAPGRPPAPVPGGPGPSAPGGGVNAFLGSPGMAMANSALNNIYALRRGHAPQVNPTMVYGEERRKNALLQERKLRNLEERRRNREQEQLWALQKQREELGIQKAEQDLDPFYEYKQAIEQGLIGPEVSLRDFQQMGLRGMDPGAHAKSLAQWEAVNPPPNGDRNDPAWLQKRSEAYDRILRPLQMITTGGQTIAVGGTGGPQEIVSQEQGVAQEAALAGAKAGAAETGTTEAKKMATAPAALENINVTISSLEQLKANPYLDDIYGYFDANMPTVLQPSVDAKADVGNIVARLVLNEREKLKGQGTISDFESKMLGQASSKLSNFEMSSDAAREEIDRILEILAGAKARAQARVNKRQGLEQSADGTIRER